jgi:acyl dehydratase
MSLKDAVGRRVGPVVRDYGWKDVALYGLAVGAGFHELEYCHEKCLKTLPTFSMAAVFDLFWETAAAAELDLSGVLHGEQDLAFHRPIPVEGRLIAEGRIAHIFDKGADKGALVLVEFEARHGPDLVFSGTATLFSRKDGGFGGPDAPAARVSLPDRTPDHVVPDLPAANQPLLYRLTGDLFDLHADPDFARRAGFERPIMHGLCTLGYACRALIRMFAPGEPGRVRRLRCRFSSPLLPGVPIHTHIWETGDSRAFWRVISPDDGAIIIDRGLIEIGDSDR